MKKLLVEETTKEMELKTRSPSVIARLMGLDGIPPPQHAYNQQKGSSGKPQHSITSGENVPRSGLYPGRRSHRKSSKGKRDFKDVFEILETSKTKNNCSPTPQTLDSKLTEAKMTFIEQKFMDVKRLSTDDKLQGSREFHDPLEELDSNKDLLLKFLQQPDALFTKHVHDLHGASLNSHRGRVAATKSSDILMYANGDLGFKLEKEALRTNHRRSPKTSYDVPFTLSGNRDMACSSHNSSKFQLDGKVGSALPTKIVVLKPNLWKMQDATKPLLPPHLSHTFTSDFRKPTELPNIKSQGTELQGKKTFPDDEGFSRYEYRESREIAKEITRQMRNRFTAASMNLSSSGFRGGEESSSKMSGNESPCELEVKSVNSKHSYVQSNQYRSSSSHSTESSVSREAKKRLSERWKMTHNSHEVSRGSTLGEMLAIPITEERPASSDVIINGKVLSGRISRNDGHAGCFEPLGISSRDGWKDGSVTNLSRSRSLPASSASFPSPKISENLEALRSDRYLMPKDDVKQERDKVVKGRFINKETLLPQKLRPSKKKHQSCRGKSMKSNDISPAVHLHQNQVKNNREEMDYHKRRFTIAETSSVPEYNVDVGHHQITKFCEIPEIVVDPGHQMTMTSESHDSKISSHLLVQGDPSIGRLDNSIPQEPSDGLSVEGLVHSHCPVAELESTASSKGADQPSPVSILEAHFTDDLSSGSECFESLSADLHGLRMQLRLLKLESCIEEPMIISSDEDVGEESIGSSEHKLTSEWSLESSYLEDVLIGSGFSNANPETFMSTCHSPEFPVSRMVFEELEKKYCDCSSFLSSERRLLFDWINSGLWEIYQQLIDPHPWATPGRTRTELNWSQDGLRDSLCKLPESQENKMKKDRVETMLAGESQWLELGDDIDAVGKDIEQLLIDELVLEVVIM